MTEFENEKKPIDEELDSDDEEPETQAEPAGKGKHKGDKKTRKAYTKNISNNPETQIAETVPTNKNIQKCTQATPSKSQNS